MGTTTGYGTTIGISAGAPATFDAAGYAALTFTTVGGVEKIGTFGASVQKIEFQPLAGAKQKHKGPADYGTLSPSMAYDPTDAGQTLLRTACAPGNNALYSVKITLPDGGVRYAQVRGFGYPETVDGATSMVMAAPTLEINTAVVKVDPT